MLVCTSEDDTFRCIFSATVSNYDVYFIFCPLLVCTSQRNAFRCEFVLYISSAWDRVSVSRTYFHESVIVPLRVFLDWLSLSLSTGNLSVLDMCNLWHSVNRVLKRVEARKKLIRRTVYLFLSSCKTELNYSSITDWRREWNVVLLLSQNLLPLKKREERESPFHVTSQEIVKCDATHCQWLPTTSRS